MEYSDMEDRSPTPESHTRSGRNLLNLELKHPSNVARLRLLTAAQRPVHMQMLRVLRPIKPPALKFKASAFRANVLISGGEDLGL